jgi:hypothetical protein
LLNLKHPKLAEGHLNREVTVVVAFGQGSWIRSVTRLNTRLKIS